MTVEDGRCGNRKGGAATNITDAYPTGHSRRGGSWSGATTAPVGSQPGRRGLGAPHGGVSTSARPTHPWGAQRVKSWKPRATTATDYRRDPPECLGSGRSSG